MPRSSVMLYSFLWRHKSVEKKGKENHPKPDYPTTNPSTDPGFLNTGRFAGHKGAIQMVNETGLHKSHLLFVPLSNSLPWTWDRRIWGGLEKHKEINLLWGGRVCVIYSNGQCEGCIPSRSFAMSTSLQSQSGREINISSVTAQLLSTWDCPCPAGVKYLRDIWGYIDFASTWCIFTSLWTQQCQFWYRLLNRRGVNSKTLFFSVSKAFSELCCLQKEAECHGYLTPVLGMHLA